MKSFFIIFCFSLLVSCSGNSSDDKNCRFLLDNGFPTLEIDLNLPSNINLNSPGNSIYIPNVGGNRGIIVSNIGFEFNAWDASDPNHTQTECSVLIASNDLIATCGCEDGNKYSLVNGQPLGNKNLRCGLKRYVAQSNGNIIVVYN